MQGDWRNLAIKRFELSTSVTAIYRQLQALAPVDPPGHSWCYGDFTTAAYIVLRIASS